METLLAFFWAPLVLYGLYVGLALLAEQVLRLDSPMLYSLRSGSRC